jgi:hypothetical protein
MECGWKRWGWGVVVFVLMLAPSGGLEAGTLSPRPTPPSTAGPRDQAATGGRDLVRHGMTARE